MMGLFAPLALVVGLNYEVPRYAVMENVDTVPICEDPLGCSIYEDGHCVILLSPIADRDTLSRQRMECILQHNGAKNEYRPVGL